MKTISLILNSRGRISFLQSLFDNLVSTALNLQNIEVLISFDNDDIDSINYIMNLDHKIKDVLIYEIIERNLHMNNRLTGLAKKASGEFIFIINDDIEMLSLGWDDIAYKVLSSFQDGIVYGKTHDNSCDKERTSEYASFPIVSKKSVEILGYFMHPDYYSLGGDVHLWRIYHSLNRVVDVPVFIRHILHETVEKVMQTDETSFVMRQNSRNNKTDWFTSDISSDVRKLYEQISGSI